MHGTNRCVLSKTSFWTYHPQLQSSLLQSSLLRSPKAKPPLRGCVLSCEQVNQTTRFDGCRVGPPVIGHTMLCHLQRNQNAPALRECRAQRTKSMCSRL